ncbi:MAG: PAS domain S-box protein [Bacteroidales bacterium]|nr:PAS domain S-box protein [Bacteroidales bacterium]
MDTINQRSFVVQNTIYAFVLSLFFPLLGISIDLINSNDMQFTLEGIRTVYSQNPLHWIILLAIIVLPLVSYYFSNKYIRDIASKQSHLDLLSGKMNKINHFTQKLIEDDFTQAFDIEGNEDSLGKSLINLRDTLKKNKEAQEKRRQEDEQRNWIAEGLARFGDILRTNNDNMEQLSFMVVKELVKYINAIQGSFYMLNNDDPNNVFFDQTALFAYDRKKFTDKKIKWGDGLVGTCALERQPIYMTKIPESYVNITSGLGKSNPKCLLLLPLIYENELYGVIEFASYNALSQHELNFAERVAESIAATIASVRINVRTAKLLEDSRERTQAMSAQEEEMRQNMEELQATQEELARQADKFVKLENTVNHTMIRADYAVDGTLLYANTKFLKKLEYNKNEEVEGKHISLFIGEKDKEWFTQLWDDLASGGRHYEGYMKHITKNGKDLWTMATYTCIRGENDAVEKILFLAIDTTEHKKQSLRLESIVDAVDKSSIKLEMGSNGSLMEYNDNMLYLFGYNEKDAKNLTIFDLIDPLEIENFNNKWDTVVKGIAFHGQFKMKSKSEDTLWLRGAFSALYDMYGDVTRIVFIGHDATNEKLMDIELRQQTDILKKQEKMLRESERELSKKLREARIEMQNQYKEIEKIKLRNERTLEGALDAIFTIGNDNKIIFFNKAAEELWGYSKEEVTGHDVAILFSAAIIEEDDFLMKMVEPGSNKIVGVRKEIKIFSKSGEEKSVLVLLSNAQVEKENTYTAFIQNVEVELF